MSDKPPTWIKIKSKLPRPTTEQHTRPLRLFAPGYTTGEDTPEANERFWEAAREQLGDEPIDEENPPMKCSRCGLMKHSVHTCMAKIEVTSPHSYGRAIDVKRKP